MTVPACCRNWETAATNRDTPVRQLVRHLEQIRLVRCECVHLPDREHLDCAILRGRSNQNGILQLY